MSRRIDRRAAMGLLGTGALAAGCARPAGVLTRPSGDRIRTARIAHLTDIHVQPELNAERWMAAALHHAQSLADPPTILFQGGDLIMDALKADRARTALQWDTATRILRGECSLPVVHCIGNHDIWGWDARAGVDPGERLYGRQWAMEALGLDSAWRRLEVGGWAVLVLDSQVPHPETAYTARLDKGQRAWLESQLRGIPSSQPVLILSHIPIIDAAVFFHGPNEQSGNWDVPGVLMHLDARSLRDLLSSHRNVRLALSGHVHLLDRVEMGGVTYLCDGSVCGKWWKGTFENTPPGYGVIDLYDDGSFEHQYVEYGWRGEG